MVFLEHRTTANKFDRLGISHDQLPIISVRQEIREAITNNGTVIVMGETGSGKTTQLPIMLLEMLERGDRIAVAEPRRIAATSVAKYVANQVGCKVGELVGSHVRFRNLTTQATALTFMTDGILLEEVAHDSLLRRYRYVMLDEAHEGNLDAHLLFGLLKKLGQRRKEEGLRDLKLIISSATLEKDKLSKYFGDAPVIEVPGRLYPVEVHYSDRYQLSHTTSAVERVRDIIDSQKGGNTLVFMEGWESIHDTIRRIGDLPAIDVLPLHSELTPEDQDRIFVVDGRRKVVVATNIAETSVTIPGVRHVIDSGLVRQLEYDPESDIEILRTVPQAKSGCIQRAGRAGRTAPGDCWRLYTESDYQARREYQIPEIRRSNLTSLVLLMRKMGITDVRSFEFIDPPDMKALNQATETLKKLGALADDESLTEIGKLMAELPVDPRIARMIIEARNFDCAEALCSIAALFGMESVFYSTTENKEQAKQRHAAFKVESSDFLTLLNVWDGYLKSGYSISWARRNFLRPEVLQEARHIREQLLGILKDNDIAIDEKRDFGAIAKSIVVGLIDNLMVYAGHDGRHFEYRRVTARDNLSFCLHPSSSLYREKESVDGCFVSTAPRRLIGLDDFMGRGRLFLKYGQIVSSKWYDWLEETFPWLIVDRGNFHSGKIRLRKPGESSDLITTDINPRSQLLLDIKSTMIHWSEQRVMPTGLIQAEIERISKTESDSKKILALQAILASRDFEYYINLSSNDTELILGQMGECIALSSETGMVGVASEMGAMAQRIRLMRKVLEVSVDNFIAEYLGANTFKVALFREMFLSVLENRGQIDEESEVLDLAMRTLEKIPEG